MTQVVNWLDAKELEFRCFVNGQDFITAIEVIGQVFSSRLLTDELHSYEVKEKWLLYRGYIVLLIRMDGLEDEYLLANKFRISKLMNNLVRLSTDKTGANVSILILRFLFSVVTRRIDSAIDQVESLRSYNYRYFKDSQYTRTRIFLKLLILIIRYNFDVEKINQHSSKLMTLLLKSNKNDFILNYGEIVPYEILWQKTMKALSEK